MQNIQAQKERERLKTQLYLQNKIFCIFIMSPSLFCEFKSIPPPVPLPLLIHHYHYACIYYQTLYNHFKNYISKKITKNNLRIKINDYIIPSNRPIGLYVHKQSQLEVVIAEEAQDDAFDIVYRNWKQAFCIINLKKQAYHLTKVLNKKQQKQHFKLYQNGYYHNIPNEGQFIAIRGFAQKYIIERKHTMQGEVIDLIKLMWPILFDSDKNIKKQYEKVKFTTHGIDLDIHMTIYDFFTCFSYNDGYCYISLIEE